jgi:hypothetical protein
MRLSSCHQASIEYIQVEIHPEGELDSTILSIESVPYFAPGVVGCQDIVVRRCVFIDPAHRSAAAIGVYSYDWGCPATDIQLQANKFSGCRRQTSIQGPFRGVAIVDSVSESGGGQIRVAPSPLQDQAPTSTIGPEADSAYDGFLIRNAVIRDDSPRGGAAVEIALNRQTTATVGSFEIIDSRFESVRENPGAAIGAQLRSTNPALTSFRIADTTIEGYAIGLYPRDGGRVVSEGVEFRRVPKPVLDDGSNSVRSIVR